MKRSLVKQGAATMMISLPSKWIKENNLDKGDEISIEEADNALIISNQGTKTKLETSIVITTETESLIRTLITSTYRSGYDKIKVEFSNNKQYSILSEIIKEKLIGFDITKKESGFIIVENVTEPSTDQFDNIFQKIFMNTEALFDIVEQKLKGKDLDFDEIEEQIIKYDNFCRRILMKVNRGQKAILLWNFLSLFNHGQRELYLLLKNIKKIKASPDTLNLLEETKNIMLAIKEAYNNKNGDILTKIHDKEKDIIYKKGYKLLQSKKGEESIAIYHILVSLRNFYQSNSPLTGFLM